MGSRTTANYSHHQGSFTNILVHESDDDHPYANRVGDIIRVANSPWEVDRYLEDLRANLNVVKQHSSAARSRHSHISDLRPGSTAAHTRSVSSRTSKLQKPHWHYAVILPSIPKQRHLLTVALLATFENGQITADSAINFATGIYPTIVPNRSLTNIETSPRWNKAPAFILSEPLVGALAEITPCSRYCIDDIWLKQLESFRKEREAIWPRARCVREVRLKYAIP
jgi:hypothetical protein